MRIGSSISIFPIQTNTIAPPAYNQSGDFCIPLSSYRGQTSPASFAICAPVSAVTSGAGVYGEDPEAWRREGGCRGRNREPGHNLGSCDDRARRKSDFRSYRIAAIAPCLEAAGERTNT